MYASYYGFREDPFSLLPDPEFLFLSQKHETALNLLELAIFNQSAFCVISGEIGTGKTTLIRELLNRLDKQIQVGLISNTHADFTDLLAWVVSAYGIEVESSDPVILYQRFMEFLKQQHARERHTLLIVDEAQNLSGSALEELRMLSNINATSDAFLQIMLVGQKQLMEKLRRPEQAQLLQRISIVHHLPALGEIETEAYIRHRLTTAGGPADLFDSKACKMIHRCGRGIPRLINKLCDLSLVYGYAEELTRIGADTVKAVIREQRPMGVRRGALDGSVVEPREPPTPTGRADLMSANLANQSNRKPDNNNIDPQPGDITMSKLSQEHPSHDRQQPDPADTTPGDSEAVAESQAAAEPPPATAEDVHAVARKATEAKAAADQLAGEKAIIAKAAIEAAAADLAVLEAAKTETQRADKLAADKRAAEKKAAEEASVAAAAAEQAKADKLAAEQVLEEKLTAAQSATQQLEELQQATQRMLKEQLAIEADARQKSEVAAKIAEEAAAAAAAAAEEAQQAMLQRVSAEKVAGDKVGKAEQAAQASADEQDQAQLLKDERVATEEDAVDKAAAAHSAAEQAAREKSEAVKDSQEKRSLAEQASEQAARTRKAAEAAAAELEAAEAAAADKERLEKIALADVAASVAAEAQKEAEEAAAAQQAALELARRKQAIAKEAARKAAAASALVNRKADVEATTIRVSEKVRTINGVADNSLDDEVPPELLAEQQKTRRGRTWFVMTLSVVIAGASGWLAFNHYAGDRNPDLVAGKTTAAKRAVSAAALEVKDAEQDDESSAR